jgi:serine/threonine protein kinase/tetratricopeptide (TPR) repeat protein
MASGYGLIWVLKIMSKDFTSGAEPEQLRQLFSIGLGETPSEQQIDLTASLDIFMEKSGSRLGRYKLLSVLGEGGMGIVYLAQQHQPMKRQVAVKIIKPGMDSKRVIARFEAERQALALLDHPNIAHIYDAGTTEAGRPYFVMEYVKGIPITEHCDHHKLTIEERLRLFQQVCQAVQHAHQKGIIHRDIKPSNILVSMEADRANPKIIDFGVAKALAQPLTERTLATQESQLLGTPEYMSPEQADMAIEDIDTRSDIYSLGVLLYVLLTGVLPFDSTTFREGGIENIRKTIRETDPKTPSTRLNKLGKEATKIADMRGTQFSTLTRHLKKELEWIPLKAMRKERSERYRSASEMADDIENYLTGEPLMAGPHGKGYKLRKFVRRNQVLVSGIAAVFVVLVAGVVVSTIFAIRAERARVEAENARDDEERITDFLEKVVLGSASRTSTHEVASSYHLDAASEKLHNQFKDKPLIEAQLRRKLGIIYNNLGESQKAEQHFLRAIEIYQQYLGEEHPDTLQAMSGLGWAYERQGRYHDMERLSTETGERNQLGMAYYYLGMYEDAESLFNEALQTIRQESGGENNRLLPYITCNLARVYAGQGRYDEAEKLYRETMEAKGWDVESKGWYTTQLANTYREHGRYEEAESLFDKTLDSLRRIKGDENFFTLTCMYGLVRLYVDQNRFEDAQTLFSKALPIAHKILRENHPLTLGFVNACAVFHTKQKEYDEAETLFKEALKGQQSELGDDHPDTLETINDLGILHRQQKHYEQAEKLLIQALEGRKITLGPDHTHTVQSLHELAMLYKEQGLYDKAEPLLLEALKGRRLKLGDTHSHALESWHNLIELYEAWNKPEKAAEWRAKLPKTEAAEE